MQNLQDRDGSFPAEAPARGCVVGKEMDLKAVRNYEGPWGLRGYYLFGTVHCLNHWREER